MGIGGFEDQVGSLDERFYGIAIFRLPEDCEDQWGDVIGSRRSGRSPGQSQSAFDLLHIDSWQRFESEKLVDCYGPDTNTNFTSTVETRV